MPDLDKSLRKVSQTIIGAFGTSIKLRRTTAGSYSTSTHKVTSIPRDTSIKGRLSDYKAHEIVGQVQVEGLHTPELAIAVGVETQVA